MMDQRMRTLVTRLVMVGAVLGYGYWEWSGAGPLATQAKIEAGEQVYRQNCYACHGVSGEGHGSIAEAPALNGVDDVWTRSDAELAKQIRDGGALMPPFGEVLTDEEISSVIQYFKAWWTRDQFESQQALNK